MKTKLAFIAAVAVLLGATALIAQFGIDGTAGGAFGHLDLPSAGTCTAGPTGFVRLCGSANALQVSTNGSAPLSIVASSGALPNNSVDYAQLATDVSQLANVTLTNAQVLAMNATPVQIIAAQGAGTLIEVQSVTLENVFLTAAFASGGAIQLSYGAGVTTPASVTVAATFLTSPVANQSIVAAGALASSLSSAVLNTAVNITNATGAFTTGAGTLRVQAVYRVHSGL